MPTATFAAEGLATMRAAPPADQPKSFPDFYNLGVQSLGGTKALLERPIMRFDLFGPAVAGRPLTPADVITAAELRRFIVNIPGSAGFACQLHRVTRPAWDYTTGSWNTWSTGNNWTTPGGDVDAGSVIAYTAPTAVSVDHIISGVDALVTDAIANRAGIVLVRAKALSEADDGGTRYYSATPAGDDRPRLVITYEGQEPEPIDHPAGRTLAGSAPARGERAAAGATPAQPERGARPHGR